MQMMRGSGGRRTAAALVIAALAVTGVTACEGDEDAAGAAHTAKAAAKTAAGGADRGGIAWGTCPPAAKGKPHAAKLTCGTVQVPLDYRKPGGTKITVEVSKLATAQPGQRRGVLVMNPGGPALGGIDFPGQMLPTLPKSVTAKYDLIGFDPRGVEHSTPQSCGLKDPSVPGLFPYPAADGSITKNVALAKADAQQCATKAGPNLRYYTTANTARDIDRIRQALGEQKISYWGQSYGTYLGAVYRSLYPHRVDRMITEGNVDPSKVWSDEVATWGKGMSERFPDAAKVAAAANAKLGLGADVPAVTKSYLALADRLDRTPAPTGTPVNLDGSLFRNLTYSMLLHKETVAPLTTFWKAALDLADNKVTAADKAVLQQVFADDPISPGVPADNQATMFQALTCGDAEWPHDVAGYQARTTADRKRWPLTAGMPANIWTCAYWPKPIEPPVKVTAKGAPNTLILQNRRDNATPWEGGQALHRILGNRSGFVGVDNGGHFVYGQGSACADKATVDFLTTGRLPRRDVYCTDVKQQ